jgi:type II secretory pathway component GspD/PulD (secretin)
LRNLDVASVTALLQTMYPADSSSGMRKVMFGNLPVSNGLFLSGAPDDLREAVTLIRRADHKQIHVLIAVTVIEFEVAAIEMLSTRIQNATAGQFTNANINLGNEFGDQLDFTRFAHIRDLRKSATPTPEVFTAMISTLMSTGQARLISRSYMSTLSGQPASINMGDDLYVVSASTEGGLSFSSATEISAGVKLEITPTAFPGGLVRMDVNIEDSQFGSGIGAVVAKKNINSAKTTMQVPHGHSLIVGGMASDRMASGNKGLPWLRFVPLVNLITANRGRTSDNQEVAIYITPYIGDPDLDLPLVNPKAFGIEQSDTRTQFERFNDKF